MCQNLLQIEYFRSLSKTHFVKTKHIKMRRDIDQFFVSTEHLEKCRYKVLIYSMTHVNCLNCLKKQTGANLQCKTQN